MPTSFLGLWPGLLGGECGATLLFSALCKKPTCTPDNSVSDHKQDDSFRVIDRRLFTAEGELRKEAVEEERRQEAVESKAAAQQSKPGNPAPAVGDKPTPFPATPASAREPNPSPAFKNLLAFLARNAELVMAGLPDPRTGRTMVDIESLRQLIDMMEVLRDKTKGNLAKEDEQLLSDVIGDLKVSFLQLQQAALAQQTQGAANRAGRKP